MNDRAIDSAIDSPLPAHRSLRAKGWMATLALLAYLVASGLYIARERSQIDQAVQQLEVLGRHVSALALTEASVNSAQIDAAEASDVSLAQPTPPSDMRLYMETCGRQFRVLEAFDPAYALLERGVQRSYASLEAMPVRAGWIEFREVLRRTADELDLRRQRLSAERDALSARYQRHNDAVTVESWALSLMGIVLFGSLAAWFFSRLAGDVRRLEAHARQIVHGARGVVLDLGRDDELGRLMQAVNRLALDLDEREKQLEVDATRRSHRDKMLALGALAAGLAHEVNNPLAAISGLAQELKSGPPPSPAALADTAQQILVQTERAARMARHLADAAAPQPAELDWVDINALLGRAVQLMGYDRRYRPCHITLQTDPALPAVQASGNSVQQVLMQMLTMGCDAVLQAREKGLATHDTPAEVAVQTVALPGAAEVRMVFPSGLDFGRGDVQRHLLLTRAIVEPLGARLAFGQADDQRQRITLSLPTEGTEGQQ